MTLQDEREIIPKYHLEPVFFVISESQCITGRPGRKAKQLSNHREIFLYLGILLL